MLEDAKDAKCRKKTSTNSAPKLMNCSLNFPPFLKIKDHKIDVFDAKFLMVNDHKMLEDDFMVEDWKIFG